MAKIFWDVSGRGMHVPVYQTTREWSDQRGSYLVIRDANGKIVQPIEGKQKVFLEIQNVVEVTISLKEGTSYNAIEGPFVWADDVVKTPHTGEHDYGWVYALLAPSDKYHRSHWVKIRPATFEVVGYRKTADTGDMDRHISEAEILAAYGLVAQEVAKSQDWERLQRAVSWF